MADALGDGEGMGVGDGAVLDLEGHVRTVEESAQRRNGGRGLFELSFEAFKVRADDPPPAFGIGRGEDGSDLVDGHPQRPEATDDLCGADLRDGVVAIPCGGIDGVGGEEVDVVVMAERLDAEVSHSGELADGHSLHQASLTSVRSLAKKGRAGLTLP